MKIPLLLQTIQTLMLLNFFISGAHIATDDFQTLLLNNDLYVDKSLLIEEFLEDMKNNSLPRPTLSNVLKITPKPLEFVPIVIRPEGWGKSTNLAMLKKFFEIEVDDQGHRLPKENQTNGKFFLGGDFVLGSSNAAEKNLKPLKIANCPDALEHLGKYPVILVEMKTATGSSFEEIENNMKLCIVRAFKNHPYLMHSPKTTEKEILSKYFNGTFNSTELRQSVYFLSKKLYEHYGEKSLIFIDDYDIPAINGQLSISNFAGKEFGQLILSMRYFYDTCYRHNPYRNSGMLCGVVVPVKPPIIPPQIDVPAWNLITRKPPFVQHYGFTQQEVEKLLTKVSIKLDPLELHSWYGNLCIYGSETFYSPRSVMRCLGNNGTLAYYGSESNVTALVDEILVQDDILQDIHQEIRTCTLMNYFYNFADFTPLFHQTTLQSPRRALYWAGYLKVDSRFAAALVVIPNEETKRFFETRIMFWMARKFCLHPRQFHSFVSQILRSEIYQFRDVLKKHLDTAAKFYPISGKKSNVFYSSLLTAIKSALSATHSTHSSDPLGIDAKEDMVLIPFQGRSDIAVVITYNTVFEEKALMSGAISGLWRVYMRRYCKQMKTYSYIRKVIQISMAFLNEKVDLQCGIEKL